ncbi:MAG: methionine adenosyltransferase [Clostridia bacterium]|nr:methionine adenosyltransferase [Clostridia bacterium]
MQNKRKLFTSESVTEGHPDKVCDQIADAILDDILAHDPTARVACEVCASTGLVMVFGEITTAHYSDIGAIARKTIKSIGYTDPSMGFHYENCAVLNTLHEQSPDIAMGVDNALELRGSGSFDLGAGDQGMMFGYATKETDSFMPITANLSQALAMRLAKVRKDGILPYLRPDGKTQVTVEFDEDDTPLRVDTVLISAQHQPDVSQEIIKEDLLKHVIFPAVPPKLLDDATRFIVNPTGRFVTGGPQGDSGLTGRKIIVDTYGGYAPHGGGSFSGKDPTKVDRSASYMARYVAKNIVASGAAAKCQIQFAYAIGIAAPVSININTFGTGVISDRALEKIVMQEFDLRPSVIIERLNLRRPIYLSTAAYGHFGRSDVNFTWEKLDAAEAIKARL